LRDFQAREGKEGAKKNQNEDEEKGEKGGILRTAEKCSEGVQKQASPSFAGKKSQKFAKKRKETSLTKNRNEKIAARRNARSREDPTNTHVS